MKNSNLQNHCYWIEVVHLALSKATSDTCLDYPQMIIISHLCHYFHNKLGKGGL